MAHEETVWVDPVGREWIHFAGANWEQDLPPPRRQVTAGVPEGWGTCAIHAYAEALTARVRRRHDDPSFEVDLPALVQTCITHGILTESGSSECQFGRLARYHGIPAHRQDDEDLCYALDTCVDSFQATHLPAGGLGTSEQLCAAMTYREHLCELLDGGPVVVGFSLQRHYADPREPDEPYRRHDNAKFLSDTLSNGEVIPSGHLVVVYAYNCPGGDVRTLRLYYQDNMEDAPERHLIHPDAIEDYHVPTTDALEFSPRPKESQDLLHYRPAPPPPPPCAEEPSLWDKLRDLAIHLVHDV